MKEQSDIDRAFYLEVIRKECKQVKAELAAVRDERDEYAECFEKFKNEAYAVQYKLAAARDELAAANAECVKVREDRAALQIALVHHDSLQDRILSATAELAAARDELHVRDEAIADFDQRARWRLEQTPYTGIGEP